MASHMNQVQKHHCNEEGFERLLRSATGGVEFGARILFLFKRAGYLAALLIIVGMVAACSSPVRLMPTPVKFTTGQIDPFEQSIAAGDGTTIPLLYATNRAVLVEARQPIYTIFPSDTLRFGVAQVRIGDGLLDWDRIRAMSTSGDERDRPILNLERLDELAAVSPNEVAEPDAQTRAFFASVNQALAVSPHKDLIIYVHGFNNAVWRGTAQAAQFHHFTGRQAVVLAFLWPSAGSLLSYATDVRVARASVPAFSRLVELLATHTDAKHINILAFSAGARIVSEGLAVVAQPHDGESREQARARLRLGQIYFAAPDEDTNRFVSDLTQYIDLTQRISVSANPNDGALRLAARHQGASRAGRPNMDELDAQQWEFLIAASQRLNFDMIRIKPADIPGMPRRAHGFWYENAWVSSDVLMQFLWHKGPQERGLEANSTLDGLRFWTFPNDYEARVSDVLSRRRP